MRSVLVLVLLAGCKSVIPPPPAHQPPEGTPVIAMIERNACLGECPAYSITIYHDGTALYRGEEHVKVIGLRSRQLTDLQKQAVVDAFDKNHFDQMDATYDKSDEEDAPLVVLQFHDKMVTHAPGDPRAPASLISLEASIEIIVDAKEWTGIDRNPKMPKAPPKGHLEDVPVKGEKKK